MSAALLETFAAGNRIVRFAPQGPEDVEKAAVCTAYTDYCVFRANDGFSVMSSVISDALLARVGIAKVYWQQSEEIDQQEFDSLSQDELDMLLAEEDVELLDSETDEIGLVSGTIAITRDSSQVVIEPVAPEEFLIESQAKSMMDAKFCAHQPGRRCPSVTWAFLKNRSTRLATTMMSTWNGPRSLSETRGHRGCTWLRRTFTRTRSVTSCHRSLHDG